MKKSIVLLVCVLTIAFTGNVFADTSIGSVPENPNIPIEDAKPVKIVMYLRGYVCTVTGVDSNSSLNIRSGPGTDYSIVGSYKNGAVVGVEVFGYGDDGNWAKLTNGKGYVHWDYLSCQP